MRWEQADSWNPDDSKGVCRCLLPDPNIRRRPACMTSNGLSRVQKHRHPQLHRHSLCSLCTHWIGRDSCCMHWPGPMSHSEQRCCGLFYHTFTGACTASHLRICMMLKSVCLAAEASSSPRACMCAQVSQKPVPDQSQQALSLSAQR